MPNYRRPAAPGFKGAYNALTSYSAGDIVTSGGLTYGTTVAVPVAGVSDGFDAASIDAAWTVIGTWSQTNSSIRQTGAGVNMVRRNTGAADGVLEVQLIDAANAGIAPMFRYTNASNYFIAAADGVFSVTAGAYTKISTYSQRFWTSDTWMKVVLAGDSISVYENNVLLETITNSARNTSTLHGIWSQTTNATAVFKDWKWSPNGVPAAFVAI
jgi:hypothetical protein